MQVLFVHGMGRSPASGWWLLRQLRRAGLRTASFGYSVSRESFAKVANRLVARLNSLLEGRSSCSSATRSVGCCCDRRSARSGRLGRGRATCSCSAHRFKPRAWQYALAVIRSFVSRRGTAGNSSPRRREWPRSEFPMFPQRRSSARGASSIRGGHSGRSRTTGLSLCRR